VAHQDPPAILQGRMLLQSLEDAQLAGAPAKHHQPDNG
jgi:hypothetical protein